MVHRFFLLATALLWLVGCQPNFEEICAAAGITANTPQFNKCVTKHRERYNAFPTNSRGGP